MTHVFRIDDSNPYAKSVVEFLKTLDFVKEDLNETSEFNLTDEHLKILDERRNDRITNNSKTHSWEDVKEFARHKK